MTPATEWSTYQALLAHLEGCADCLAERDCAPAARIRRALRAARAAAAEAKSDDQASDRDPARGG
ncbi:hypothetical protein ACFWZT_01960 [Streptomyces alboflavus]|uniref:hypothetical protein n=1 Tax=Streptomyces alboflavus TaxID=67267 RepID=UPI00369A36BB